VTGITDSVFPLLNAMSTKNWAQSYYLQICRGTFASIFFSDIATLNSSRLLLMVTSDQREVIQIHQSPKTTPLLGIYVLNFESCKADLLV